MVRSSHAGAAFVGIALALSPLRPSFATVVHQNTGQRAHVFTRAPVLRDWTTCGFPNSLTAAGDDNVWFEVVDGCYNVSVGFITPAGNMTVYPTNADPFELTACPRTRGLVQSCYGRQQGAWLVNADPAFGGPLLERVDESGHIRTVPLSGFPENGQFSIGVTLSSPTTMWVSFSEPAAQGTQGYIGAIVPQTGVLTAYALPLANVVPAALTLGADGNVWFVASNEYLGKVSPSGAVSLLPSGASAPLQGITPGPDGNVWFTAGRQVGHTTPSGTIQYVTLPVEGNATDIAAGADGNMWMTSGSYLIRLSLYGDAMTFPIPFSGAFTREIVRGPKRTLWFNEINEPLSRIGEVQL